MHEVQMFGTSEHNSELKYTTQNTRTVIAPERKEGCQANGWQQFEGLRVEDRWEEGFNKDHWVLKGYILGFKRLGRIIN